MELILIHLVICKLVKQFTLTSIFYDLLFHLGLKFMNYWGDKKLIISPHTGPQWWVSICVHILADSHNRVRVPTESGEGFVVLARALKPSVVLKSEKFMQGLQNRIGKKISRSCKNSGLRVLCLLTSLKWDFSPMYWIRLWYPAISFIAEDIISASQWLPSVTGPAIRVF